MNLPPLQLSAPSTATSGVQASASLGNAGFVVNYGQQGVPGWALAAAALGAVLWLLNKKG